MSEIKLSNKGTPFPKEFNAKSAITIGGFKNARPIQVEGGWGIEILDESVQEIIQIQEAVQVPENKVEEPKKEVTTPWRPAQRLSVPAHIKDSRFVYRYGTTSIEGNIEKKIDEKWEKDPSGHKVRELILLRMPKHLAKERNDYYHNLSQDAIVQAKERYDNQLKGCGVKGFGEINVSR